MSLIRRRRLTKNQTRQIQKNQDNFIDDGTLACGVIVSHFGKQLDVQITQLPTIAPKQPTELKIGDIWRCHARTNLPMMAAGDEVKFSVCATASMGRIESLSDRRTLITRPDRYNKVKPVAANVDTLAIVFAPLPKPATNLIDRYLLVARFSGVQPLLVLNKADLLGDFDEVAQIFQEYQLLGERYGFKVMQTSSISQSGIHELKSQLNDGLTIFAGQSGVGKSSLINHILPNANQSTNVISVASQLGQHTTTTSRLLAFDDTDLAKGGIIDTPGIREYGIWHLSSDDVMMGFDELSEIHGECRFRDCNHAQDTKGCAFWRAVADGRVLARRLESFNELIKEAKMSASAARNQSAKN
ncbi:ribosome small subunit-dependent GTPase A [Moraxella sp. Tifton1]|uniref:ribosome small subunit-dependent GTPase A n=1 Tax=Moraxella oculi TaxID=2940516 RepID=UPI002012C52D|nr:ribosome small subunit-dependent GTPase A [Moraxella sp. Tifton1]MCL1623611.1 ribosome small subunit-dependent GTPase A [Moraxella sp. Tifton1]